MELRFEEFGDKNVRFLGYNFLRHVSYNGEPVTPRILSEKPGGFEVEHLGGVDFIDIEKDKGVKLSDKLGILSQVVGQLKEIDRAGFVIFDRRDLNIRVLSHGKQGISVRQIDIEDIYDKATKAFYTERFQGPLGHEISTYEEKGMSLWCSAVADIADIVYEMTYGKDLLKIHEEFHNLFSETSVPFGSVMLTPVSPLRGKDVLDVLAKQLAGSSMELKESGL